MNKTDIVYAGLLSNILATGDKLVTRNHAAISKIDLQSITFDECPLVTVRKTAWQKALREMEWFMSGNAKCPDELLDWWDGQLNKDSELLAGYPWQLRYSSSVDYRCGSPSYFDQVAFIKRELREHPNSRRLLISTWNPGEMAFITEYNHNSNTPTCCHGIVVQFFVRNGKLHMTHYQRSADMLLGVPHNWIQYWALLTYFAHHAGLEVGTMQWLWGDAHIYDEESHAGTAEDIISCAVSALNNNDNVTLEYSPTSEDFKAADFKIVGTIPKPLVTARPRLL